MKPEERIRKIEVMVRASTHDDDKGKRVLTYRGITETVADDGGILRAEGADWSRMDTNANVQWNHGHLNAHDVATIGRVIRRRLDAKARAWDFDIEFVEEGVNPLADMVYRMGEGGFLVACSIRFRVLEFEDMSRDELQSLGAQWVGKRYEPRELSIVDIGSDPESLKRMAGIPEQTKNESPDFAALTRALGEVVNEVRGLRMELRGDVAETSTQDMGSERTSEGEEPNSGRADADANDEAADLVRALRELVSKNKENEHDAGSHDGAQRASQ